MAGKGFFGTHTPESKKKMSIAHLGKPGWNKGLTKETDERVARLGKATSRGKKGKSNGPHSEETKNKIRIANTGKHPSEETRKKLSELHKGNPGYWLGKKRPSLSSETKQKMSETHLRIGTKPPVRTGKENNKWKGGISKYSKKGYKSTRYKYWRKSVFERDNYTCQNCGKTNTYLTAHHIKSWAQFPEFRFDINNGVTLCEDCHSRTDNYKGRNKKVGVS